MYYCSSIVGGRSHRHWLVSGVAGDIVKRRPISFRRSRSTEPHHCLLCTSEVVVLEVNNVAFLCRCFQRNEIDVHVILQVRQKCCRVFQVCQLLLVMQTSPMKNSRNDALTCKGVCGLNLILPDSYRSVVRLWTHSGKHPG